MWDITYIFQLMMMSSFKTEIEDYLDQTGISPSRFGRDFLKDPGFVYRLRKGGECRPSTIEKLRKEMRESLKGEASVPSDAA